MDRVSLAARMPARPALRSAAETVLISGSLLVSNTVIAVVLGRLLGPTGYGVFAVASAAALLLAVPAVLGLAPLLVRTVAAALASSDWPLLHGALRRARQAVLVSSGLLVGVTAPVVLVVGDGTQATALLVALALIPLVAWATVQQAAMQGLGRVSRGRLPEALLRPAVFLSLVSVLAVSDRLSGTSAVAALVAAAAASALLGALLLRAALPDQVRAAVPAFHDAAWRRSLLPLLALNGIAVVNDRLDVLLLGALSGSEEAGVYSVAFRVAGLTSFFLLAAAYPASPLVARLWAERDVVELQRVVRATARAVTAGGLVVALVLVACAGPLLDLFGPGFGSGRVPLLVLVVGQLVNAATGIAGLVLMMTGHERLVTRAVGSGAAVGVLVTAVLVPLYGATGAALGTATGVVLSNVWLTRALFRATGVWAAVVGGPVSGGGPHR